jgi:tetratricopeptide (TPR) repeat protein
MGLLGLLSGPFQTLGGTASDPAQEEAKELVNRATHTKDSDQAVQLLWRATDLNPSLIDSYVYLGNYYYNRNDYSNIVRVFKKLLKYHPTLVAANLNLGEAYMSFTPPQFADALKYYRRAYELDPHSQFAALRIGQILAQQGRREEAVSFLKRAASPATASDPNDQAQGPDIHSEAKQMLARLGVP